MEKLSASSKVMNTTQSTQTEHKDKKMKTDMCPSP